MILQKPLSVAPKKNHNDDRRPIIDPACFLDEHLERAESDLRSMLRTFV